MGSPSSKPKRPHGHKRPRPKLREKEVQPSPQTPRKEQDNGTGGTSFKTVPTEKGRDIMISYSHDDAEAMRKLEGALKASGISVWVDESALTAGSMYLREIGEAIVASKLFIVLLSASSVQSKYCQDEVSLAYISNKNIFAVSLLPYEDISGVMDLGMKLTLSCVQWTFLQNGDEEVMDKFVATIRATLDKMEQESATSDYETEAQLTDVPPSDESTDDESAANSMAVLNKQALNFRLLGKNDSLLLPKSKKTVDSDVSVQFWKEKFADATTIDWTIFVEILKVHMSETWSELSVSEETIKHLLTLMAKEMNVSENKLKYKNYMMFCTRGREVVALDEAINLFAAAAVAVREVFQIDSSVRLTAIEHLGDHKSKAVINVLLDLLYDEDQDVRVVAAISLAHAASEIRNKQTRSEVVNGLLSCLTNDDRLVRESGCLALGRMKSKAAIKKLVYLWRNDYISTVRAAAHVAIEQIGGDDAEQALHVTRVLGEEIEKLRKT